MKTIYLVLPCYNEEAVLHETSARLKIKMNQLISENKISKDSRITFVDDGSKDNTWSIIEELKESDELFAGIKLSRNRGHQNALLAGLMTVKEYCDGVIIGSAIVRRIGEEKDFEERKKDVYEFVKKIKSSF